MPPHRSLPWLVLFVSLCLSPAQAGSPGSADRKAALPHVCGMGPLAGESCDPTLPESCGTRGSSAEFPCVPDFRGQPTLRGTLWVVVDADVGDNLNTGRPPAGAILMEFRAKGKRFRIAEIFQGGAGGPEVGHWLPFGEDEIADLESSFVFQTPVEALGDVGEALKQVASQVFGGDFSDTIPVFFDAQLVRRGPDASDQYTDLGDLGRAGVFDIAIKFLDP